MTCFWTFEYVSFFHSLIQIYSNEGSSPWYYLKNELCTKSIEKGLRYQLKSHTYNSWDHHISAISQWILLHYGSCWSPKHSKIFKLIFRSFKCPTVAHSNSNIRIIHFDFSSWRPFIHPSFLLLVKVARLSNPMYGVFILLRSTNCLINSAYYTSYIMSVKIVNKGFTEWS